MKQHAPHIECPKCGNGSLLSISRNSTTALDIASRTWGEPVYRSGGDLRAFPGICPATRPPDLLIWTCARCGAEHSTPTNDATPSVRCRCGHGPEEHHGGGHCGPRCACEYYTT